MICCDPRKGTKNWLCLKVFSILLLAPVGMSAVLPSETLAAEHQGEHTVNSESKSGPHELAEQKFRTSKPAAHLSAVVIDGKLTFSSNLGLAFLDNEIKLEDNKLVIPSDGLYFVYAKVAFRGKGCGSERITIRCEGNSFSDVHPEAIPLFSSTKYVCGGRPYDSEWLQPFFQGAVFMLRKGDRLAVTAEPISNVDEGNTYFGAFAV